MRNKKYIIPIFLAVAVFLGIFLLNGDLSSEVKEIEENVPLEQAREIAFENIALRDTPQALGEFGLLEGYELIGENDMLQLLFNYEDQFIAVVDKGNGNIWSSPLTLGEIDEMAYSEWIAKEMRALFNFSYSNMELNMGEIINSNNLIEEFEVALFDVENGIGLKYDFPFLEISIAVEIFLDENSLVFNVPKDQISERGTWGLVHLEPLPFLGAAQPGEEGYFFYPCGSGALFYLNEKPKDILKHTFYIYGSNEVDFREFRQRSSVFLPVFGIKKNDNAFLAVIEEGKYDAAINLQPADWIVNLNRISAEFTFRRLFRDPRIEDKQIYRLNTNMIKGDRSIRYFFLNGDKADYSGMANVYRDYLLRNNKISRAINPGDTRPVGVSFFMGITEDRVLFDRFVHATRTEEARQILETLTKKGVNQIDVNLIGWQRGGYGHNHLLRPGIDGRLGGQGGLNDLNQFIRDNGFNLFLQSNFVIITEETEGFTPRRDMVYQANGMAVSNERQIVFLLNAASAWDKLANNYVSSIGNKGVGGLSFEFFGINLYQDYNENNYLTRQQTAEFWGKILDETKKQIGQAAVSGGNAYVLQSATRLFDIPMNDNGYFVTTRSVPFFQMVVHGLIPYSSTQPGNLFHDFSKQKLKWVEYGYMPYFALTYQKPSVLRNTRYNHLFSSYHEDWVDTIAEVYEEFNERLGHLWSQQILEHEQLMDDVYAVTYEDGTKIFINYRTTPVQIGNHSIDPVDFLVVRGES